ncbi:hypothetical protein INT48_006479 [Thamnidium elegans]|uniref:Bud emergence protein 1 n=1 Tax=Thamnidium elegans TaxID=101142 RepID=A0A8H7SRL6_9FUNG|nr:hypothetical protein INT48_006479 [Thamnidium elegans]
MFLPKEKVKVPRSLRTARLSVVKNKISTPVIQTSTSTPKKVIKALYDYQAQSPHELSFIRGDFFLVTGREADMNFYEAFNPITNSRGVVPVPYFQVLEKHERAMVDSVQKREDHLEMQAQHKPQPLYGIVLYDFQAERSDELDAKAGEPIIIIAQSNAEWFVAKPIGRLGGPGLIPVSFVDIRDASTGRTVKNNVMHTPSNSVFPNVEDWKKQTQGYEASSISLGNIERQMQQTSIEDDDPVHDYYDMKDNPHPDAMLNSYGMTHLANSSSSSLLDSPIPTSTISATRRQPDAGSIVISAYIDSHILEGDQYWFIVFAKLANGKHRVLYRLYDDFYDFQMNFLQEFPAEAGKQDRDRILPYMPGPLDTVNDDITADRARDLSKYCDDLIKLPRYLAESAWVQEQLFGIHEGDIETDIDPGVGRPVSNTYVTPVSTPTTPNITTPTAATPTTASTSNTTIKVKIVFKDEIFAIKVPATCTIQVLESKIIDRLGFDAQLKFKDGNELHTLSDEAFASAINVGKLTVVAS